MFKRHQQHPASCHSRYQGPMASSRSNGAGGSPLIRPPLAQTFDLAWYLCYSKVVSTPIFDKRQGISNASLQIHVQRGGVRVMETVARQCG